MKLTAPTRRAIAQAQRRGIIVTLATGRNYQSAKSYADRLGLEAPLICANGALVRHRNSKILLEKNFDSYTITPLLKEMQGAGAYIQVYHNGGIISSGNSGLRAWLEMICDNKGSLNNLAYSIREYFVSRVKRVPDLAAGLTKKGLRCHKLFLAGKAETLVGFQRQAVGLGLSVEFYPAVKEFMYLEITPPGVSKGWALTRLAEHLGVGMESVVAIGDNLNDCTMISKAGLGIAMGNGHTDLKALASHITLSNNEDGVAVAINGIIQSEAS